MELKLNSVIIIAVLLSANVFADNIPNTFEAGEAIKASEMNENFVDLQNQIDVLKNRYPGRVIGWSTHESPEQMSPVQVATAKGARMFERHVGINTSTVTGPA